MYDILTKSKAIVYYEHVVRSLRKASKKYNVSKSVLHKWIHQKNPHLLRKQKTVKNVRKDVKKCIEKTMLAKPFTTMRGLADICQKECNLKRSPRTMSRYMKKIGWTIKNVSKCVDHKHDNDIVTKFCKTYNEATKGNLICIDESGFYIGDHPRKGWSPKGKKLSVFAGKSLRRSKLTLVMACSSTGIVHHEILDHNCKKIDFLSFINNLNAPRGSTLLMVGRGTAEHLRCETTFLSIIPKKYFP